MGAGEGGLTLHIRIAARRASSRSRTWLAAVVWAVALTTSAQAQEVPARDTIPGDTLRVEIPPEAVAADTLPGDSLMPGPPDSLRPAPGLPEYGDPLPTGWAFARWEWSRDELLRYRGLSVLDLVERLPGVHSIRSGGFGRPAGLSPIGLGGTTVRVLVDGFELDALGYTSHELEEFGLVDLEAIRVERTPAGLRIDLTTFRLPDARAYSEVEAAAGNYGTRLLRGTLSRVAGSRSTVTASYDLATTRGEGLAEPFQARTAKLRWSYQVAPRTGLQLELRQGGASRGGSVFPVDFTRRDVTLRARSRLAEGLTVEGLVGRTMWRAEDDDAPSVAEVPDTVRPDVNRNQALLRALWARGPAQLETSARFRTGRGGAPRPSSELTARGALRPLPLLHAEGRVSSSTIGGSAATAVRGSGRIGPFAGLSIFGSLSAGERWATIDGDTTITFTVVRVDTVDDVPQTVEEQHSRVEPVFAAVRTSAGGARVGAEWTGLGAVLGVAAVALEAGDIVPFGLPFDRQIEALPVEDARGAEAYLSLPVPWTDRALRVEAAGSAWHELGGRPYLPEREGRVALEYHDVKIDGQFEPTLRIEAVHRGSTLVPLEDGSAFGFVMPQYTMLNLFLQIRVLDVRAYLFWENPTNNRAALDLPPGIGFQPGQRVVYGARWWFRN